MVDLLPIYREHYYHPAMMGSWSIKAVLPTIAPDLDYSNLEVGDGGAAQEAYLRAIWPFLIGYSLLLFLSLWLIRRGIEPVPVDWVAQRQIVQRFEEDV